MKTSCLEKLVARELTRMVMFHRKGEDLCPFHRDVLIKWEVRGKLSGRASPKTLVIGSKRGVGKIECQAMSVEGNCLKDWRPCPVNKILEMLLVNRRK